MAVCSRLTLKLYQNPQQRNLNKIDFAKVLLIGLIVPLCFYLSRFLLVQNEQCKHQNNVSNMFKVNIKDTRTTSVISHSGLFIVDLGQTSQIVLVLSFLTLNKWMPARIIISVSYINVLWTGLNKISNLTIMLLTTAGSGEPSLIMTPGTAVTS